MIIVVNRFTDTVTKIKPNAKGNHMMKKIIAIALAAVTVLSFAACTKQNGENGTTTPSAAAKEQAKSALEILEKVWSKYSNDEKFPATGGSEKQMKEDMPGKFDVSDAEALDFELGFPKAQASEIDDAASLMHMLNQNSFSCGVYHVKDSANVEALASKIKENILARQWMCGFPEKLVILSVGNYIVSVFGAAELTDTFTAKLSAEYSLTKQLCDVPIA
jgi:putative bacteriocin transport accessory protein